MQERTNLPRFLEVCAKLGQKKCAWLVILSAAWRLRSKCQAESKDPYSDNHPSH
jgi:hypothetical protein